MGFKTNYLSGFCHKYISGTHQPVLNLASITLICIRKYIIFFVISILQIAHESKAQENHLNLRKGLFYFYWGYNRNYYSETNLHFNGPNYDFTLYGVRGFDRQKKLGWDYINPVKFSVPQYNYRAGYFITDRIAISAGMDHTKYVVAYNQQVTISGTITPAASQKYAGTYLNEPIELGKDLLIFEHTDGFNLISFDIEYFQPVKSVFKDKISLHWNLGIGGMFIMVKTNVRVMGDGLDNKFHIAGLGIAGKTGPRVIYKNLFFLSGEIKGGYASMPSVLIKNSGPESADHKLYLLEYYIVFGIIFKLKRKSPFIEFNK